MLLGELMTHIARLLNFDEPEYKVANYGGWNPEAVDYWVKERGRQPIQKLRYPILPDLVYPVAELVSEPPKMVIRREAVSPTPATIKLRLDEPAASAPPRIKLRPQDL
jgi:hypothetical protein